MRLAKVRIALYAFGVLAILLAGYPTFLSVSARRVSTSAPQVPAGHVTLEMYRLAPGEVLRFLPRPPREVRRAVCVEVGLPASEADRNLVALSLTYDGKLQFRSATKGHEYVPRRLIRVILDSLDIPLWRIRRLDVAQRIGLSGDWVVRTGARPEALMEALVRIVRQAGYPGFRAMPLRTTIRGVVLRGRPFSQAEPVELLPAVELTRNLRVAQGDAQAFARVLSNAIERPVRWATNPPDVTVRWRDHSAARRALSMPVTDALVQQTLDAIAQRLGVEIAKEAVETTVWELRLDAARSP